MHTKVFCSLRWRKVDNVKDIIWNNCKMYSNFNCLGDGREFVPQQKYLYRLGDKED